MRGIARGYRLTGASARYWRLLVQKYQALTIPIQEALPQRDVAPCIANQIFFFFIEYLWNEVNNNIDFQRSEVEIKQSPTFKSLYNMLLGKIDFKNKL